MNDDEILERVRVLLDREADRAADEAAAAVVAGLGPVLHGVDEVSARAERITALRASKGRPGLSPDNRDRLERLRERLERLHALMGGVH